MKSLNNCLRHGLLWVMLVAPVCLRAQGVYISQGAHLVANGSPQLVLTDASLVNNGVFTAGKSTIRFTDGTPQVASIGGGSITGFYNLILHKEQALQLNNNILVSGTLDMQQGNLQLNRYQLDLGHSGIIADERNEAYISGGTIKRVALLQAPDAVNPGNIGVSITSKANLGETVIIRGSESTVSGGNNNVHRYFDIVPANNQDLQATLRFHYLDAELAGRENELTLFSAGSRSTDWKVTGSDHSDIGTNWVTKSKLGRLNRYTLAVAPEVRGNATLQAYPNPFVSGFVLNLPVDSRKQIMVQLLDQHGRLLEQKKVNCLPGQNTIQWNMVKYPAGNYHLSFGGLFKSLELVKQ
jgi:hypothetical protein